MGIQAVFACESAVGKTMGRIVETRLQFTGACAAKPVFHGRQQELDVLPLIEHAVRVEDLRDHADGTALNVEGFVLRPHETAMVDFLDPDERRRVYLPELERLVLRLTGAAKAIALGSSALRRSERSAGFGAPGTTVLGRFVHSDYSPNPQGSRYWLDRILPAEEAAQCASRRYAIYNIWRVLSEPPQDTPLALCDLRSLSAGDRLYCDCVHDPIDAPEQRFELSLYRFNPAQRWVYFSNMTRAEALVFKGFDTECTWSGGVPHAAFDDLECPPDALARESVDERVIAFF
jgi:hypothetical protein